MDVQKGESSVKTGAVAPVTSTGVQAIPTKAQLAQQAKEVLDAFQEATVLGRQTTEALVRACKAFYIFEQDAKRAQSTDELTKVIKAFNLKPNRVAEYLKRVRGTGEAASHGKHGKDFAAIQHALAPYVDHTYEAAMIFLHGTDLDRKNLLNAVAKGDLTVNSTRDDIRALRTKRSEHTSSTPNRRGSTAAAAPDVSPDAMTNEQIAAQAKAQGIASPAKVEEVVRQVRGAAAESARALPLPTQGRSIDLTPSTTVPIDEPVRPFQLDDMIFTDITVEGDTIGGRFVIQRANHRDKRWRATLPTPLREALQHANR